MKKRLLAGIMTIILIGGITFVNNSYSKNTVDLKTTSCYEIGVLYATCAILAISGDCPPHLNFVTPKRCRNNPETKRGIQDTLKVLEQLGN